MTYSTIRLEQEGMLAILTLNRPDKLNALSDELFAEVRKALAQCEADPSVRAMIITGEGKAFSAGFDIAPRDKPRSSVDDWREHAKDANGTWLQIWRSRLPVVALPGRRVRSVDDLRLHHCLGDCAIRRAGD